MLSHLSSLAAGPPQGETARGASRNPLPNMNGGTLLHMSAATNSHLPRAGKAGRGGLTVLPPDIAGPG